MDINAITSHKIFRNLKNKFGTNITKCLELMDCEQDFLFVWDPVESCINCLNIKHSLRDSDSESDVLLSPTQGMLFEVERLKANITCTLVCLSGPNGVAVINLPERWAGQRRINVPLRSLSERLYLGERRECYRAKWHPGSPSDTHLVTLSSDECLRCYNARNGSELWKCLLSKHSICSPLSAIPSRISLGDTPVDFDFAPPIVDEEGDPKLPILVLWGNGDVYCAWSTFSHSKVQLTGPLRMYPPSDDNYGSDASSLLVIGNSPPLVVLSTCSGTVYHCILVGSEEAYSQTDKSLLVVEAVELDIGFNITEQEDLLVSSPILLYKNPVDVSRYFCVHKAGVHSVTVPLVGKMYELAEDHVSDIGPYSDESIVDYMLCTGLTIANMQQSHPTAFPLGFAFVDLSRNVLVLFKDEVINVQFLPQILHNVMPGGVSELTASSKPEGFALLIEQTLQENSASSWPITKLGENAVSHELFEVFSRTTAYFTKVAKVHKSVALQMESKANSLRFMLTALQEDIASRLAEKAALKESAELIAERYEELKEKQTSLVKRLENIMLKTYNQDHGPSAKEKIALETLNVQDKKAERYDKELNRLKSNFEYYKSVCKEKETSMNHRTRFLDDNKANLIKKQLSLLMTEIAEITRRVRNLKTSIENAKFPVHT